jgi:hypothetical protein
MRSNEEIRSRVLEVLESMLRHPSMHGVDQGFELAIRNRLSDLAFIDGSDATLERAFERLRKQRTFGECGAAGTLAAITTDPTDALASIYARVATELGYFVPLRRLSETDWKTACDVQSWLVGTGPWRRRDIEDRLGPPSYKNDGWASVLAYAGPSDDFWLYFDFPVDGLDSELAVIRLPQQPFASSVIDLRGRASGVQPEDVYRAFLRAAIAGDEVAIRPLIVQHGDANQLWAGAYPKDVAATLDAQYRTMSVHRVPAPDNVTYVTSEAFPFALAVVRDGDTWRVDADPLIAMWSANKSTVN